MNQAEVIGRRGRVRPAEAPRSVQRVRAFWNTEACGTHFVEPSDDPGEFFAKYRDFRYRTEWHIPEFARFEQARDAHVLEIGCGNGVDGAMFAASGAHYTGIDLTDEALEATQRHFAAAGLTGQFRHENCESLSFPNETFDVVYSFGVLHHTPEPEAAVREVYRVLKPGGKALVMLYHKHSFNYYVRIMGFMRARVLLRVLSRLGRWEADRRRLRAGHIEGVRGNASREVWRLHYENFLERGFDYLRAESFVHHATDGPECPCAFVYTRQSAAQLFSQFRSIEMSVAHLPLNKYPIARYVPRAVERFVARCLGWHLLIRATK